MGTWMGTLPALYPEWISGSGFVQAHNVRFPYVVGDGQWHHVGGNGLGIEALGNLSGIF